jgi:hypothetical protein
MERPDTTAIRDVRQAFALRPKRTQALWTRASSEPEKNPAGQCDDLVHGGKSEPISVGLRGGTAP